MSIRFNQHEYNNMKMIIVKINKTIYLLVCNWAARFLSGANPSKIVNGDKFSVNHVKNAKC